MIRHSERTHPKALQLGPAPGQVNRGQDVGIHQRPIGAPLPAPMLRLLVLLGVVNHARKASRVRGGKVIIGWHWATFPGYLWP